MKFYQTFLFCLMTFILSSSLTFATGPRVSPAMFSNYDEIFSVDLPPLTNSVGRLSKRFNAILSQQKIPAILTPLPVKQMVRYLIKQEDTLAVLSPYLELTEKDKAALIDVPFASLPESYIYYKPHFEQGLDWRGKLVNMKGYIYGARKEENVERFKVEGVAVKVLRFQQLLPALVSGKVDFIRLPNETADWLIRHEYTDQADNFIKMPVSPGQLSISVLFNKHHPLGHKMAEKFALGMKRVK